MNIGILTYHRARNYGAFLQSVALCSRLNEESDIKAEIIDFDTLRAQKAYAIRPLSVKGLYHFNKTIFDIEMKKAFERGYEKTKLFRSEKTLISDNIVEFQRFVNNKYDVIIVGSDEVWNTSNFRGFAQPYFLIGVEGCRKFSYAASARCDYSKLSQDAHKLLRKGLQEFEFISVRDSLTYNQVLGEGVPADKITISCDPSFLYNFNVERKDVNDIVKNKKIDARKRNILVLCENKAVCKSIYSELHNEYNLITAAIYANGFISEPNIDPFEWMELIKSVDFVISSFFHGSCYSLLNDTPFIAVASSASRRSKLQDLLGNSPLKNRFVDFASSKFTNWSSYINNYSNADGFAEFICVKNESFNKYIERLKG